MKSNKRLTDGFYYTIISTSFFIVLAGCGKKEEPAPPAQPAAQSNPCAPKASESSQNPCAVNPCAAKNPCAANPCAANPCAANPCAPGGQAGPAAKAIMVRGQVVKVDPGSKKLLVRAYGKQLDLTLGKYSVVREGPKTKSIREIKPGDNVMVSYVQSGGVRTAWYVYLASAASLANPCGGNPCAAANPCAATAKRGR